MRPIKKTYSATGAQPWIPVDFLKIPFNVSFGVVINSGTATFTVEHTFDDILGGETARAFQNPAVNGATANADGNYVNPITAIRLNISALGAGDTVDFMVLQGHQN